MVLLIFLPKYGGEDYPLSPTSDGLEFGGGRREPEEKMCNSNNCCCYVYVKAASWNRYRTPIRKSLVGSKSLETFNGDESNNVKLYH
jgi:hypothetical protein